MLDGLDKPANWSEAEYHFQGALAELGWSLPAANEALLRAYALDVAEDCISGELRSTEGCREIYRLWMNLEFPADLARWIYIDEGLHPDTYADLSGPELDATIIEEAERLIAA